MGDDAPSCVCEQTCRKDVCDPREWAWSSSDISDLVSDGMSEDSESYDDDESSCGSTTT